MSSLVTFRNDAVVEAAPARVTSRRFYHPELDILRFFAFLLVFCHHALPHWTSEYARLPIPLWVAKVVAGLAATGAFGVDIFFVLSSYLITELLLREKSLLGEVDVKSFYARRVLRIWPLYFGFLGIAAAMQFFVPGQHIGWRAALAFTCLGGNWWIVLHGFPQSVIFPLWSISIEEQFYLFWPAVVKRATAATMVMLAVCMLGIASLTRFYLGLHGTFETQAWCNTLVQLDPIAAGVLIAVALKGKAPEWGAKWRAVLMVAGVALLASAANLFRIKFDPVATRDMMLGYPAMTLGASAVLLAILSPRPVLGKSVLVYLGRISYGLYVFHILALWSSDHLVPNFAVSGARFVLHAVLALTLTIMMASASYRWLETPFLNLKQRFTHVPSRNV